MATEAQDMALTATEPSTILKADEAPIGASTNSRKRAAEDELSDDEVEEETKSERGAAGKHTVEDGGELAEKSLSKRQQRKLRKRQKWEELKEDRRVHRKEKRHAKQERKRAERDAKFAEAQAAGLDLEAAFPHTTAVGPVPRVDRVVVPIAFIVDCDFEKYMRENEMVSLSSQIVRSYAANKQAKHRAHMWLSGWKGALKHRFENEMRNTHSQWRGVHFLEGGFEEASINALEQLKGPQSGKMVDTLRQKDRAEGATPPDDALQDATLDSSSLQLSSGQEQSDNDWQSRVVYLTADSQHTLERLEAGTCYVIGGLVDKNREKGICQRRAEEAGVRTAKLPIGDYMKLQSRAVLATNQVVEILSDWLVTGDWAKSFFKVIPKRKGGVLRETQATESKRADSPEKPLDGQLNNDGQEQLDELSPWEEQAAGATPVEGLHGD